MTIPSSLFSGGGGASHSNNGSLNLTGIQEHQPPAALQMVGLNNDSIIDSSAGTGTAIQVNNYSTNTANLFGSAFDEG